MHSGLAALRGFLACKEALALQGGTVSVAVACVSKDLALVAGRGHARD